ncbi:MAG: 3-methyl-2-oxobutanoate hydroxymethyltransferase [Caldisericaceae bacterium]|nr:3-methyl-2-oxobutanoate hydroxymethyltransferase [Caldisericaceae bacterium]
MSKITVPKVKRLKGKRPITALTAYDFMFARILDRAGIDIILVGDSVGTTVQGLDSTLPVNMEEMLYHVKIVKRGVKNALLVGDMPFLSYQTSESDAIRNAGLLLKAGAEAVKLEGGERVAHLVEKLVVSGIPVMGHIGLTPQSVNVFGGYKIQGKTKNKAERIINDAVALQEAGVFSIVLEGMPEEIAKEITETVQVPTIGIGAGRYCDGQILVITDILGMDPDFTPRFVKKYRNLYEDIGNAVKEYISDVENGRFPAEDNVFHLKKENE